MTTKTYIIPIVVTLQTHEGYEDKEAQFVATSIRGKIYRLMGETVSVIRWSVDKPNESEIKL